jgi:hypothetical protein
MKKLLLLAAGYAMLLSCNNKPADSTATDAKDTTVSAMAKDTKPPQSEFADPKYTEMGKKQMEALASGNIDGWLDAFADNAMYRWSSGDSLAGKAAIAAYWKDRRTKVIDSIQFSNDIWLPLKVNQPQKGPDIPGIWLLGWYQVDVKYKNGKKLNFWVHADAHYNSSDKIDLYIQYIDRAPINKALGK